MAVMKVKLYGSEILRKKVAQLEKLPDHFETLIADMYETMNEEKGIGLSANQVGLDMSFFIVDFGLYDEKYGRQIFINPEILEMEGETLDEEGCLSLPGINEKVKRADRIRIKYKDANFTDRDEEYFDYLSRVIQHEFDHLNGIVFTDRISALKRSFIKNKLAALETEAKEIEAEETAA
ncbi:MAG: peptide deformylase [Candidatus Marinimicrobia bacterium]|nr:peptide deformylase [Candidatus Neomarinimicrobiota bacterium]